MPIDVNTTIPVPADTDNYDLVADLVIMRNAIVESLDDVIVELGERVESGGAATFYTLVCESTGRFGTSVTIETADTGADLVINNSAASWGINKSGVGSLLFTGGRWVSSSRVTIGEPAEGADAATANYVLGQVAAEAATRLAQDIYIENKSVIRSAGRQDWAPNADYASVAGSANSLTGGVPAHNHDGVYAPAANRPAIYTGRITSPTIAAHGQVNVTITLPSAASPLWFGMTVDGVNGDEVFAGVRASWGTGGNYQNVPVRLKNEGGGSEVVGVRWVAMY